jgi:hypothetical protein
MFAACAPVAVSPTLAGAHRARRIAPRHGGDGGGARRNRTVVNVVAPNMPTTSNRCVTIHPFPGCGFRG